MKLKSNLLTKIVKAVQAVEAYTRIDLEMWQYIAVGDEKLCQYCEQHDGQTFSREDVDKTFPDHQKVNDNMILPHVHVDLVRKGIFGKWSEHSCRCALIKVTKGPLVKGISYAIKSRIAKMSDAQKDARITQLQQSDSLDDEEILLLYLLMLDREKKGGEK